MRSNNDNFQEPYDSLVQSCLDIIKNISYTKSQVVDTAGIDWKDAKGSLTRTKQKCLVFKESWSEHTWLLITVIYIGGMNVFHKYGTVSGYSNIFGDADSSKAAH